MKKIWSLYKLCMNILFVLKLVSSMDVYTFVCNF